jgi:hypothetical protein
MRLSDWWYYTGTITKTLVIVGIAAMTALALIVASPHVAVLKPIAEGLGLVQTIYVPVNHTVYKTVYVNYTKYIYMNKTVPVYINRTVYVPVPANESAAFSSDLQALADLAGFCSGRIVVLPNDTAWFVVFWLVPKEYLETPYMVSLMSSNRTYILVHYNSTTHYAQYLLRGGEWAFVSMSISPWTATITGTAWVCYYDNVTINNQYYVMVCGDTPGIGPMNIHEISVVNGTLFQGTMVPSPVLLYGTSTYIMPRLNTTYTGIVFFGITPGPVCNITLTYAPNPQAALWLPVTTNQTLINYMNYAEELVYGHYNPYDNTMGFSVWRYPS